jgi:hypothetical protein
VPAHRAGRLAQLRLAAIRNALSATSGSPLIPATAAETTMT